MIHGGSEAIRGKKVIRMIGISFKDIKTMLDETSFIFSMQKIDFIMGHSQMCRQFRSGSRRRRPRIYSTAAGCNKTQFRGAARVIHTWSVCLPVCLTAQQRLQIVNCLLPPPPPRNMLDCHFNVFLRRGGTKAGGAGGGGG